MPQAVEFLPLPGGVGVEVLHLDLRQPQSASVVADVVDAFYEHQLLLVRGPELAVDDQVRFAEWFGAIRTPDGTYQADGYQAVETYMSNTRGDYRITEPYALHRDDVHTAAPCRAMCLHAQEVSEHGGETVFADAASALETLAPTTRARLDGLTAVHIGPAVRSDPTFDPDQLKKGFRATGGTPEQRPSQSWPVVLRHPVTGVEVLYVDPATLYSFEGLAADDEQQLRDEVLEVFEAPIREYRHTWTVGDTIIWDNVSLLHARTAFPPDERRTLRKVILGAPKEPWADPRRDHPAHAGTT